MLKTKSLGAVILLVLAGIVSWPFFNEGIGFGRADTDRLVILKASWEPVAPVTIVWRIGSAQERETFEPPTYSFMRKGTLPWNGHGSASISIFYRHRKTGMHMKCEAHVTGHSAVVHVLEHEAGPCVATRNL